jgi:hypothetical protein
MGVMDAVDVAFITPIFLTAVGADSIRPLDRLSSLISHHRADAIRPCGGFLGCSVCMFRIRADFG